MTTATHGHMAAEIAAQPELLARLVDDWDEHGARIRPVLPARVRGVIFVGRGSSDNVAMLGRYAVELGSGLPTGLAAPSLRTRYPVHAGPADQLVVALSQSGRVPEVVHTARSLRGAGSRLVAITNDPSSPLAAAADLTLALGAGTERAVPATKTVTTQTLLVLAVAEALADVTNSAGLVDRQRLAALPNAVARLIDNAEPVGELAERWRDSDRLQVVGRGLTYGALLEAALKIRETAGVFAQALSSADLVHGPIAGLGRGTPVLAVNAGGPADPDPAIWHRIRETGADVAMCSPDLSAELPLCPELDELLQSIAIIVRGQQLAAAWSRIVGRNPDAPAGLSKVTET